MRFLSSVIIATLIAGLSFRLGALFLPQMPLKEFFITEDGYLMLTVARNLAIGNGLSVSAGEIATNGIQPLATFLFAGVYFLVGGDKTAGIAGIVIVSTAVSVLTFWAISIFARKALLPLTSSKVLAYGVGAIWFVGPVLLFHSMNALETSLYTLLIVSTACYFAAITEKSRPYTLQQQIVLGSLCGLVFLARNDGAFFVAALFLVRFIHVQITRQASFWGAVKEALPPGVISLLWAAPWLLYNYRLFGTIVPISGYAQSIGADFAVNAPLLPSKLFEHLLPFMPIPSQIELTLPVMIIATLVVVAMLAAYLPLFLRRRDSFKQVLIAYLLYAAALTVYYGLFFGAGHFMSRYLAPTAPLLTVIAISVTLALLQKLFATNWQTAATAFFSAALFLSTALLGRSLIPGQHEQGHFQVVRWIDQNVPGNIWVGAVQTGTIGYWHDKTINLDGKVNPQALRARMKNGDVLHYAVDSKIQYVADWAGVSDWIDQPKRIFADNFEIIVFDAERNLVVMKRK